MTKEQIIDAVKEAWIQDFGNLGHDLPSINGYFMAGFIAEALKSLKEDIIVFNANDFKRKRL